MDRFKVYLAGPITGLTFGECTDWRDYAVGLLEDQEIWEEARIVAYSPMRAKDYLLDRGVLSGRPEAYDQDVLSSAKGILTRDHWDVQTSDLILINLLGATQVSIGTVLEIGFAHAYRKPVVVAMEEDNIHHHAMLDTAVGWIVDDLDYAIDLVKAILLPSGVKVAA